MVRKKELEAFNELQHHWGWLLGMGIVLLLAGFVGLGMATGLTLVSMYFFSVLLIISGVSHFVDAFKYREWKGAVWQIFIALIYCIAAIEIAYNPFLASTVLTAIFAWTFIILGVARLAMLFSIKRTQGWGWLFFAGVTAIILGVLILMQWPMSGLWIIGLFIAIEMIVSGWTYIFIAFGLRATKD